MGLRIILLCCCLAFIENVVKPTYVGPCCEVHLLQVWKPKLHGVPHVADGFLYKGWDIPEMSLLIYLFFVDKK